MRRTLSVLVTLGAAVVIGARPPALFHHGMPGPASARTTPASPAGSAESPLHAHPASDAGRGGERMDAALPDDPTLPPSASTAADRLAKSPRHREDVMIPMHGAAGTAGDSLHAWVFYPQTSGKAPVVVVIHEIFGMSTWIKGVADQLAAQGYIAIVPDFLYGKSLPGAPDSIPVDAAIAATRTLDPAVVQRQIDAAAAYATHLPAALPIYGTVGFCWGGGVSFTHDVQPPATTGATLKATVVYYGVAPDAAQLAAARAPVLGLYGGDDARVVTTVPPTDSAMRRLHKPYEYQIYQGAGHGFLRAQEDQGGANAAATRDAWPRTIGWFRKYLRP